METIFSEEFYKVIKQLKNRKFPGPDGISYELLKYDCEALREAIWTTLNKILHERKIALEWQDSITNPTFRKSNKKHPIGASHYWLRPWNALLPLSIVISKNTYQ